MLAATRALKCSGSCSIAAERLLEGKDHFLLGIEVQDDTNEVTNPSRVGMSSVRNFVCLNG